MADEERLAEILGEAYERLRPGEEIDIEALIEEHPDLAKEIEAHLGLLSAVDRVVGRGSPEEAAAPSRIARGSNGPSADADPDRPSKGAPPVALDCYAAWPPRISAPSEPCFRPCR